MKRALTVLVGLLAFFLLVFHQQVGVFTTQIFFSDEKPSIAHIIEIRGEGATKTSANVLGETPIKSGDSIQPGNTIRTGLASVQIQFGPNGVIELEPGSLVAFELNDIVGEPLIKSTILQGKHTVISKAHPQRVMISSGDISFDLSGRHILGTPWNVKAGEATEPEVLPSPEMSEPLTPAEVTPTNTITDSEENLSDDYIQGIIKSQKPFLNRCFAEQLSKNPRSNGILNFVFTILPEGRVDHAKLLSSTIDDKQFQKCVLSVIERCRFRTFKGAPVVVNYPIQFD